MAVALKRGLALVVALFVASTTVLAMNTTANAAPYVHAPTCALNASVARGSLTVSGSGWRPGGTVSVTLHNTQSFFLGSATPQADGTFSFRATIPSSLRPGTYQISFHEPGVVTRTCTASVTVPTGTSPAPPPTSPAPPPTSPSTPLAFTGVAVMGIGGLGVLLLIAGGLMLLLGRRQKGSRT